MEQLHQGDVLKIEKIKHPVLVVSKDFFNSSGEIIGCPIIKSCVEAIEEFCNSHDDYLKLYFL